jgi:hypothetical protein
VLAVTTTFWLTSLVNLVLLAENRLSLSTEDTVTPLRIGFLVEFLAIIAWTVGYANASLAMASRAEQTLLIFGSAHLALVAAFAVTDDFIVPRRVLLRMRSRPLLAIFGPGAGRGATYVLMQMGLLYLALAVFPETATDRRWLLAVCGYICFFTGVPVLAFWRIAPARVTPLRLRVTVLVTLAASMVLPDIVHYAVMRPEVLDVTYSGRHLLNPLRTISNWSTVEAQGWVAIPFLIGLTGLMAHVELIRMGARATARPVAIDPHHPAPVTGEAGSGDVLY